MLSSTFSKSLACSLIALFAASTAHATFIFGFSGTCSEACGATAAITPGAGTLTIVLTDTQANPRSAGDLLSSLEIGLPGIATLSSQNGSLISVTSNTGFSTVSGNPTHWGVSSDGTTITLETAGFAAQSGKPTDMIIGPPDGTGNYSNANASIIGGNGSSQGFNPYIRGSGTFVVSDAAITASTDLSRTAVTFDFGTGPDFTKPGTLLDPAVPLLDPVPLPGSLPLFVSGLIGLGLLGWRRKRAAAA